MPKLITSKDDDPQLVHNFEIEILSVLALGQSIKYRVLRLNLPAMMVSTINRYYQGGRYVVPTRNTSPNIVTVSMWDNDGLSAWRFMKSWFDGVSNGNESFMSLPERYVRGIAIYMHGRDQGLTDATVVTLSDAFPVEISDAPLAYGESGAFTFDVKFQFHGMGLV